MSRVCEFIYLRLRPDVRPEEPGNREGEQFMDVLRATKMQSGHESSAWGRTVEDENDVVWVIG